MKTLGQIAREAFLSHACKSGEGWDELGEIQRAGWEASAVAVLHAFVDEIALAKLSTPPAFHPTTLTTTIKHPHISNPVVLPHVPGSLIERTGESPV